MSKKLEGIFNTYAYNPQQKNQLRIADEKKMDLDKIKNPAYDWEQMREIILCMEYGVDPAPLCDPSIPSESMEEIRTHLFENQGVFEAAKEKIAKQRTKRLIISFLSLFIAIVIICVGFWQKNFILSFFDSLELVLVDKRIDIGVSKVGEIKYIDFVKSYNDDMELILPEQEIVNIGEYTLHYQLKNESKVVKKDIIIVVYDDIKPNIELVTGSVVLKQNSSFNSRSYLKSVSDNVDGNLMNKIKIKDDDFTTSSPGTYKVIYSVEDRAGNESSVMLNVTVERKETTSGSSNNSSNSSKPSTSSSNSSKPSNGSSSSSGTRKPASKSFTIDTYSSFDECLKACENYIYSQKYVGKGKAEPIKKDGLFFGYKAVFE